MPITEFRQALNQALDEEMIRDEKVYIMGEEVAEYNGAYKVTKGLLDKFGEKRVRDTPITEAGFTGLGIGSAMMGLRPVIEYMSWNFSLVAIDQIISNAAKMHYMTGGQFSVPIVMRGASGAAAQVSCQHSHNLESFYAHIPGLIVMAPSTPYDAKGLLKAAIRNDNPVIFLENEMLYGNMGEVPEEEYLIEIGKGDIKREGTDVTICAHLRQVGFALEAAKVLAKEGISAEVVDPRTIKPLDIDLIAESVRKTKRLVVAEEGHKFCGFGAEVSSLIHEMCFDDLDHPVIRVSQGETPLPYAKNIEAASLPGVQDIVAAVKKSLYK
ncbi:pyruvate dehydrogenase complex E1 component subunit beta [Lentisphaera profundi]|uniref:Pyruvate dehydrogenase complex E1 component subunit beta n=1 Tax=Lentisphaera profundi TaxID=1658616 RepID=A0ABY7VSR8_9BACT|nr:pyruvate dehydrogenase complex E1 component subunit beta [Lentisphaera profundi]WDE95937.1 pyruvate dehydrogenase complex E1 component subunit beta [Lentisphaera profundi]